MTGAEALQKILDGIDEIKNRMTGLETSVNLIEANIKTLNNRAAGLIGNNMIKTSVSNEIIDVSNTQIIPTDTLTAVIPQTLPTRGRDVSTTLPETIVDDSKSMVYKKAFGRLLDGAGEPIEGVLVKVFDKNNEVCATTETDAIGYFESMVRIGRFVAEYTKPGFKTVNKTFEVKKNDKEVEIK